MQTLALLMSFLEAEGEDSSVLPIAVFVGVAVAIFVARRRGRK